MSDDKFSFESIQDSSSIVDLLESITQGFRDGSIVLSSEKKYINLTPDGLLHFSIKARQKTDESKLELRIRWKNTAHHSKKNSLRISSE
jgi:amphi-Trp domain-containing protein